MGLMSLGVNPAHVAISGRSPSRLALFSLAGAVQGGRARGPCKGAVRGPGVLQSTVKAGVVMQGTILCGEGTGGASGTPRAGRSDAVANSELLAQLASTCALHTQASLPPYSLTPSDLAHVALLIPATVATIHRALHRAAGT